jgi:uncharacterized repeat protein (TIGR01451 family)
LVSFLLPSVNPGDQINITGEIADNFTLDKNVTLVGSSGATINGNGARILTVNAGVNATLSNLTLRNGGGNQDGGLVYNAGTLTINDAVLTQSEVVGASGGAIYNVGTLTLNRSVVSNNKAQIGGGIENRGVLFISTSSIVGNVANSEGGGIDNFDGGAMHLTRAVVMSNSAAAGGGIYNDPGLSSDVWLTDTVILSNTAQNWSAGIYNRGPLSLFNSTLSGNHLPGGVGVAIDHQSGALSMQYVTIAGNTVVNRSGSSAVNLNSASAIQKTVIANSSVDNCSGTATSNGYNLSSDATCNFNQATDLNTTDALLGSLQPSSGAYNTFTHAPRSGSPLVNRIPSAACGAANDQRGVARPQDGACDIGAHEAVPVDLALAAQASPASLPAGTTLTVQLNASNAGAAAATNVVITSDLPAGTTFDDCTGASCNMTGSRLTATLGTLNAGANAALSIRLKPQQGGNQSFTFHIAGAEWDKVSANNAVTVSADILQSADLSISLSAPQTVLNGSIFTLTAEVENRSLFEANAVSIKLSVPSTVMLVRANGEQWNCKPSAVEVFCTYGSPLPAQGKTAPVHVVFQSSDAPATLQFVGDASSSTFDPNPTDNKTDLTLFVNSSYKVLLPVVLR